MGKYSCKAHGIRWLSIATPKGDGLAKEKCNYLTITRCYDFYNWEPFGHQCSPGVPIVAWTDQNQCAHTQYLLGCRVGISFIGVAWLGSMPPSNVSMNFGGANKRPLTLWISWSFSFYHIYLHFIIALATEREYEIRVSQPATSPRRSGHCTGLTLTS